jgi:hypothetical protein
MKVYALPRGGQRGVHGGMVNVPTNLTKIRQMLPRLLHSRESITILVGEYVSRELSRHQVAGLPV